MYTASVYAALASLIFFVGSEKLQGKRVGLFSYGSGLAASLFSCKVIGDLSKMVSVLDLDNKLKDRKTESPEDYEKAIHLREQAHLKKDFTPQGSIDELKPGTYYLEKIDDRFRRSYGVKN